MPVRPLPAGVTSAGPLARIGEVVHRRFGVDYTLAGLDLLPHRIGWSVQVPAREATERDEEKTAAWARAARDPDQPQQYRSDHHVRRPSRRRRRSRLHAATTGPAHPAADCRGERAQASAALYRIVMIRLNRDTRTRLYLERRTKQGLSKHEVIRCLKRYVAREIYGQIQPPLPLSTALYRLLTQRRAF